MTPKGQIRDPNMRRGQYLENSWRCYLVTIANYCIVCSEAARLASDSLASCFVAHQLTWKVLDVIIFPHLMHNFIVQIYVHVQAHMHVCLLKLVLTKTLN